jgi:5-methylthioadenosine/S-adenosylhomocysteine deaminase
LKLYCDNTALLIDGHLKLVPALLTIEGSYIQSVQTEKQVLKELPSDTIQLSDKMLTPSFINPHTHLAMSFFRAIDTSASAAGNMVKDLYFKLEKKLSAEDVRAFTRMGAYEAMSFGVGTVWDHYYHGESVAQALCDVGLTGVVAPTLQDLEGPAKDAWEREWSHTEHIHKSKILSKKGVFAALGPHATDTVSTQLWEKIQREASQQKLPMHLHLAQSRDEFHKRLSVENLTPTQFLSRMHIFDTQTSLVLAHGIYLRDDDLKRLASHPNANLVFCPFSQMIFEFPANILRWEEHGLRWLIATDTVGSNDSMNVQKELRAVSGFPMQALSYSESYQKFMFNQQSLEKLSLERVALWKTTNALRDPNTLLAKVWHQAGELHPLFKVGRIAPQYFANLIVWDLDHPTFWPSKNLRALCFNDSTSAIHNLLLGGRWMGKDASFAQSLRHSSDYLDSLKEAKERLKSLLRNI